MRASEAEVYAIVLAAGKGTRMKSDKAKVLHQVCAKPMIIHVMEALAGLPLAKIVVITGHQADSVEQVLAPYKAVFVRQEQQLGTGHAVLAAEKEFTGYQGTGLILCGDTPLIEEKTLAAMIRGHLDSRGKLTVMTTHLPDPANYGRVVVNDAGHVEKIVEEKDADYCQRKINEVNAGVYCVDLVFLFSALKKIGFNNQQKEMYLTDIVEIAVQESVPVAKFNCGDTDQIIGVNSQDELARAARIMQERSGCAG